MDEMTCAERTPLLPQLAARQDGYARPGRPHRGAFTFVEMLVTMGIILILVGLTLAVVVRTRQSARNIECMSNLRAIGQAFTSYALNNNGAFPDPLRAGIRWENALVGIVPSKAVFRCASDEELYPAFESSYDWRDTGDPITTLAGRRLTDIRREGVVLAFESLPGWHAKKKMNAVRVDGSVQTYDERACLIDLVTPVNGEPMPESIREAIRKLNQHASAKCDGHAHPLLLCGVRRGLGDMQSAMDVARQTALRQLLAMGDEGPLRPAAVVR